MVRIVLVNVYHPFVFASHSDVLVLFSIDVFYGFVFDDIAEEIEDEALVM